MTVSVSGFQGHYAPNHHNNNKSLNKSLGTYSQQSLRITKSNDREMKMYSPSIMTFVLVAFAPC